jgi:hypothetical protein
MKCRLLYQILQGLLTFFYPLDPKGPENFAVCLWLVTPYITLKEIYMGTTLYFYDLRGPPIKNL